MKTIPLVSLLSCFGLLLVQNSVQAAGFQSSSGGNQYISDEIIVKFKPNVSLSARSQTVQSFGAKSIQTFSNASDWSVAKLPAGQTVTQALSVYANDPNVEYAQPNYIYHSMAVPNDPDYNQLWAAKNTGQTITTGTYSGGVTGTAGDDMNLEKAWNVQTDCSSVIVAVVDSGVNYNSTDLAANMWNGGSAAPLHGWNFVTSVQGGTSDPMDYNGHGTHVAGIIGAVGNNSTGTTGVCWKASIMAVRVMDTIGKGTTSSVIQGIDFARTHGAKIINMSLGGAGPFDQAYSDAITRAETANVLVVVAAGNENSNNDAIPSWPCNFTHTNILCVAALDQNYALANFSNWGQSSVDVGAPGTNIRSTWAGVSSTSITDPLTGGWNFSSTTAATGGGWGYLTNTNTGTGVLATPIGTAPSFWGTKLYNANTDDRAYKTFNLSTAAAATIDVIAAANVRSGDFININVKAAGADPFAVTGTKVLSGTNLADGALFDTRPSADISECISATCSIGFQLKSALTSPRAIGVVVASFNINMLNITSNTSYNTIDGTSMATPEVAGVAALVWAHNPSYTYTDVANAIKKSGRTIPSLVGKTTTGKAVDAMGALSYIAPPTGITVNVQ